MSDTTSMQRIRLKSVRSKIRRTGEDIVVDTIAYGTLILLCLITIIPFMQVITVSISSSASINRLGQHLIPIDLDWSGYKKVLSYPLIWQGYLNTIVRTVVGVSISLILYLLGGYALSKSYLPNRKLWTAVILFTMYFSGGLIPNYILIKSLGMYNTFWALVLPCAVGGFNLLIMRNFMMGIPPALEESACIDGASEFRILWSIVIPLSTPVIATIGLWSIVYHWNEWFNCMLYIGDESKYVLQLVLRRILLEGSQIEGAEIITVTVVNTESMKMAALLVSTLPVLVIYPFLQKYFVKGMLIGSVKG